MLRVFEICAGAGGMALGLEKAGFAAVALVEIDSHACATLRANRPSWNVLEADVRTLDPVGYEGVELFAGGVPCPPFSVAGKQLGADDDRDLFPTALDMIERIRPKSVFLENVPGFAASRFLGYRRALATRLNELGYWVDWAVLNASDYGVPQLRPRFILVALQERFVPFFEWPAKEPAEQTVGECLADLMGQGGWPEASSWADGANGIAPTLVGGSKKHGGADLGPTRARAAWSKLGVNGLSLADAPPGPDFPSETMPRLTLRMTARVQGFPDSWRLSGGKTAAYRQVGNALPPPVAEAVGRSLANALMRETPVRRSGQQLSLQAQMA
ncbi:MAG: DNA cytosine methyltransferase [Gemmatimonadota bacterium]|nr:DNA cytosine methyltransferase [Gemmatimonadota bacterium]